MTSRYEPIDKIDGDGLERGGKVVDLGINRKGGPLR